MMTSAEYVPGLAGIAATKSQISYVDGERGVLEYRGISLAELVERSHFAETAFLLVEGRLPTQDELSAFSSDLAHHRRLKYPIVHLLKLLPRDAHPMDSLQTAVAALGAFYRAEDVQDPRISYEAGVRLIAKLPTLVAAIHRVRSGDEPIPPRDDLDHAANFLYMLAGEEPDPELARLFDVCLILHAEHTINASTFAALIAASTLADPYAVVSAAIGTFSGPLHGGAAERVLDMLREVGSPENARPYVEAKLRAGERIVGMGHRVYRTKDPRATILQGLARRLFTKLGPTPLYGVAEEVERVAGEHLGPRGIYPNVDFYLGIVYQRMGIPQSLFTPVFAMARVAGWVAHWREQLAENRLFRPGQLYTGLRGQPYVPLAERR